MAVTGPSTKNLAHSLLTNPLFSISEFYEPQNIKEVFHWCRKIVLSNEVVSAALHKLSEAPLTDILYEHDDPDIKDKWKRFYEQKIRIRQIFSGALMDLATYSNAFLSVELPVHRFLVNPSVHNDFKQKYRELQNGSISTSQWDGWYNEVSGANNGSPTPMLSRRYRAERIEWQLRNNGKDFYGPDPVTGKIIKFERMDRYYPSANDIYVKRWDPNQMEIFFDEVTDIAIHSYRMRYPTRKLILAGNRDKYNTLPWEFIDAAVDNRLVRFKKGKLYHLANVNISGAYPGWGIPRLYSGFRMIFYYLSLLKANQSIAVGKINDLEVLFPQMLSSSAGLDPAMAMPGAHFVSQLTAILKAHHKDPNFRGIMPFPVGTVSIGGQGRMQLISNELEPVIRSICTSMGLPYDMLYGGGAYTGQAAASRVFAAQIGLYRERIDEFFDFLTNSASNLLGKANFTNDIVIRMKPNEGPDEMPLKQTIVNAALNNKLSMQAMCDVLNLDYETEIKRMKQEAMDMAGISLLMNKGEAMSQVASQNIIQRNAMQMQEAQMQQQQMMQQEQMASGMMPQEGMPQEGMDPAQGEQEMPSEQMAQEALNIAQQQPDKLPEIQQWLMQNDPQAFQYFQQAIQAMQGQGGMNDAPYADAPDAGMPVEEAQPDFLPPRRDVGGV